jgi:hypothetical protein
MIASQLTQTPGLTVRFDAFGSHVELQAPAKANDGRYNRLIIGVLLQISYEATIDFDVVNGKLFQVSQRGVTRAEIVESDLDAMVTELRKS